jgi:serine/threonine-protein kinase RsbW
MMDCMPTKTFPGHFSSLEMISHFVVKVARDAGLDDKSVYGVQLAVDEAATNIIEHGYGGEGQGEIRITCEILKDGIKIELVDRGKSFDINAIAEPSTNAPLEDIKPRGLGVFFMRRMMDDVRLESSVRTGNRLIMIKRK